MIRLQFREPYIDNNRLRSLCTNVLNAFYKMGLIPYPNAEAIRDLIQKRPQKAVLQLCCELVRIANVPVRKEVRHGN